MNSELKQILELQKMDRDADLHRKELEEYPLTIEKKSGEIQDSQSSLEEKKNRLVVVQLKKKECDLDLASQEEKIRKHEGELNTLKSNDSYKALLKEIGSLKEKKSSLEDEILNLMVETDQIHSELLKDEAEAKKAQARILGEVTEIKAKAREKEELLKEALKSREELAKGIQAELLAAYNFIRKNKKGVAVVPVSGESCGGCNTNLTPSTINEVKKNKGLVRCDVCQRILYEPESALPVANPASP